MLSAGVSIRDWIEIALEEKGFVSEKDTCVYTPAGGAGTESPTGCADAPCEGKAGTDASMPEKADTGHDGRLLPQIAKLGQENGFFLAPMRGWGLMLWANDRMAAEAARDIAPWVLDHHAEILAELAVGSPMVRDWTVPRVVFVGLGPEGKILENYC